MAILSEVLLSQSELIKQINKTTRKQKRLFEILISGTPRLTPKMIVKTIGHSTRTIEELLNKLKEGKIDVVVDVRSKPYSKWVPHFNRYPLEISLLNSGILYLFRGNNLGGLDENVDFDKAIDEVYTLSKTKRLVLLCSESDYMKCHRYNTLTPILEKKGATVFHIVWDTKNVNGNEKKKIANPKIR